jgi:hypothetical protein
MTTRYTKDHEYVRLTDQSELDGLLTEEQYQEFVKSIS